PRPAPAPWRTRPGDGKRAACAGCSWRFPGGRAGGRAQRTITWMHDPCRKLQPALPGPVPAPADSHPGIRQTGRMDERELVARLAAGPASGADLARTAGLTRAAVWKQVQALRAAGLAVEAVPGRGYALPRPPDLLEEASIRAALPESCIPELAVLEVAWS